MCCFCRRFAGLIASSRSLLIATITFLVAAMPAIDRPALAQNAPKQHRKVIQTVDPDYPTVLRNGHFEGQVVIEATVLANGTVSKVDIKGGNPMLSQYAAQAVMKWKYAPGPEKTIEEVIFHFNANDR